MRPVCSKECEDNAMNNPVVIKTRFRHLSDQDYFFNNDILMLLQNPDWAQQILDSDGYYAGPFCYTPWERDLPF